MANIELRFKCSVVDSDYIKVSKIESNEIEISCFIGGEEFDIILDKSTAIKFAKTLRTEINKLEDVNNG